MAFNIITKSPSPPSVQPCSNPQEGNSYDPAFESPLTDKTLATRKRVREVEQTKTSKTVRVLFTGTPSLSLSELYGIDFENPGLSPSPTDFFALKEQVALIEKLLQTEKSISNDHISLIRAQIKSILHSIQPFSKTMVQLGLMYYFIARRKNVDEITKSYVALKIEEINTEVETINSSYKTTIEKDARYLTGGSARVNYLLRTFAHIIFPQTGEFNKGGVYAAIHLLNVFAADLKEEHVNQINAVLSQLLNNAFLSARLQQSFDLHPDGKEIVRLVLKLGKEDSIHHHHFKIACLIALFHDRRQYTKEINCFAVAAFRCLTYKKPESIVKKWIKMCSRGVFQFEGIDALPIYRTMQNRFPFLRQLDHLKIPGHKLDSLVHMQTLFRNYQIPFPQQENQENLPLQNHLVNVKDRDGNALSPTFVGIYLQSFVVNTLQETYITDTQFTVNNLTPDLIECIEQRKPKVSLRKTHRTTQYHPVKHQLLDWLFVEYITKHLNLACPLAMFNVEVLTLLSLFESKVRSHFWLEDIPAHSLYIEGDSLYVETLSEKRNLQTVDSSHTKNLKKLIEASRCFLFFNKNQLQRIYTYQEFRECLLTLLDESLEEQIETRQLKNVSKTLRSFLESDNFYYELSKIISSTNKSCCDLDADFYKKFQTLLIYQDGGSVKEVLKFAARISFEETPLKTSTPQELFERLCEEVSKQVPANEINNPSNIILAQCEDHVFIVTPYNFAYFLHKDTVTLKAIIENEIAQPAREYRFEVCEIEAILVSYSIDLKLVKNFLKTHNFPMRAEDFIDLSIESFHFEHEELFCDYVFEYMLNVDIETIPFEEFCDQISPPLSAEQKEVLCEEFEAMCTIHDEVTLQEASLIIRKIFLRQGLKSLPVAEIVRKIAKEMKLPYSIYFADSNYADNYDESPTHNYFVLNYDFKTKKPQIYLKDKSDSRREDFSNFSSFSLLNIT